VSQSEPLHGNVLVLVDDAESGDQLGRAVAETGERPRIVRPDARFGIPPTDQEASDLVITDLSSGAAASRALLTSLLTGELLAGVPRIHLYRNEAARREIAEGGPDATWLALPYPPSPQELQVRVRLASEVGRLRRLVERAEIHDPLTALCNRRFLLHRLEEEFARARRHKSVLSLLLLDIDALAEINDVYGHTTGDSVIQRFAEILRGQTRRENVVGRFQGATFAAILPGNGFRGAATYANKVRNDTEEIVLQHGSEIRRVHVSAGITTYPDSDLVNTAERLLKASERALREAKARGGNRVFIDEAVLRHERRVVLMIDSDAELLDLAEDLLAVDDLKVVRAENPRTALETLRFRKPDLLVIDLQMADSGGSAALIDQIQGLFPGGPFPIIGLSRDGAASSERLARLGLDRFLTKPFSLSLLRSAVRELLETKNLV